MAETLPRRQLFRWMGWFALANALLLAIIGLRYFSGFTPGGTLLSWVYLLLVYPAHHLMLAVVPLFLVVTPLVLIWPARRRVTGLAVILLAMVIAVVMLDSLLWSQSRFHINALTLQILGWQSWVFVAVIFVVGLIFESMLASWTWRWVEARPGRMGGVIGLLGLGAVLGSQLIHAWADASYYVPVTSVGSQIPVYEGITANRQFERLGLVDPGTSRERALARRLARQLGSHTSEVLNYPQHPLLCRQEQPLNLLLIMADALRSDMLQEATMPFLWGLAQHRAQWFSQHYSGGNSSRMGVFSLFYGLPPAYWDSFESLQRPSVLIDELQRQGYQLGLFSSATISRPVSLDRTAFANVRNLRVHTEPFEAPAWQRDQIITREWMEWLQRASNSQPFFGFLFYDATNAQDYPATMNEFPELPAVGDGEWAEQFSNYQNSVRLVDGLIESVLENLSSRGLADNTVVIITSDHGEEFNDSGQGLRKHGSAYSRFQLQVPMLIIWPDKAPQKFDHRTSHYDLVPTVMEKILGCSNPPEDYASGRDLFDGVDWNWLLAGSYYNYAMLEPDQVTVTYPNGSFEVRDLDYHISAQPGIRGDVMEQVSHENTRFYRQ